VLAGAAVDEPLHLLHIGKNKGKNKKILIWDHQQ
jgi:hypothetical protein